MCELSAKRLSNGIGQPLAVLALSVLSAASFGQALATQITELAPHNHASEGLVVAPGADRMVFFGPEEPLTLSQLMQRADIVVIGRLMADSVKPFTANTQIVPADRDPRLDAQGAYHDASFHVRQYLKASGPQDISVRWLASTAQLVIVSQGQPELAVGGEYALLLKRCARVFTGGYEVLGVRGVGVVTGDVAHFGTYGDVSIAQLESLIRTPAR